MTNDRQDPRTENINSGFPIMSSRAFAAWGTDEVAYVRPAQYGQMKGYSVHTADGKEVGFAKTYDLAAAAILQNELHPVSVH